jgi:deoxycytidylate deaminase
MVLPFHISIGFGKYDPNNFLHHFFMSQIIIGFVGAFGSGCSFLAHNFIEQKGYTYLSLSDILKQEYAKDKSFKKGKKKEENPSRGIMQDYGDYVRKKKGNDYLSNRALEKIKHSRKQKWIIDSIRNPAEIDCLKKQISETYIFSIYADTDIRWNRKRDIYNGDPRIFSEHDKRDQDEHLDYGQRVEACFLKADIAISNNFDIVCEPTINQAHKDMSAKVNFYIELIEGIKEFKPTESEALMAMAFAASARSSCLQRKVGAIIIDKSGQVFSSGFNEVAKDTKPCADRFGQCYRKHIRENVDEKIKEHARNESSFKSIKGIIKGAFKNLDRCPSLHAEEVAILGIARNGGSSSIQGSHMISTTYPCNLCANKIVQVGINNVTYLEPYPMQEAKEIFARNGIKTFPFEGVSFNGYFRFKKGVAS